MSRPLDARVFFKQQFGYTPTHLVRVPGRIELLGNHTDYNQGLVLALAVDQYVSIATSPRSDGKIELVSSAFPQRELFWLSEFKRNPGAPWADYVKGMLDRLRRHGVPFSGFTAAIHSTIPPGAGLGSSGALAIATALAVRQLHPCKFTTIGATSLPRTRGKARLVLPPLTKKEKFILAHLCQSAESEFVGVQCGLLDPLASLFGRAFHALQLDFLHHTVESLPMIGEISVVICDSGVKHALNDGSYNELRELCASAARKLGARSLRSVELPALKANRAALTGREYECAYHILGENTRVIFGERALREDDFEQFGQYLFQSHDSSRDYFRNSCPELDLLVDLARAHPACLGARLTGGGFGGATVNLVVRPLVKNFMQSMAGQYLKLTGHPITPLLCQVVDGVG
jgi:galactokinase